ncbi:MAG: PfkB family carbohydrate kinase [Actinomycetota bacterium]
MTSWQATSTAEPHVVCCGLTTLDLVYEVDAPPAPDEKVVARDLLLDVGGPAANAARVARSLGCRVTLVTALGEGPLAELLRDALEGIDVEDVAPPGHRPPVSTVLVSGGMRAVISMNATRLSSPAAPLPRDGADALLVDGHLMGPAVALATAARRAGIPVVLDGGSWKEGTWDLLPNVEIAAVSADFALPGGRDVLPGLLDAGAGVAVRTNGPNPIDVLTPAGGFMVEVPTATVVDSLGAGDVFHGALAAAVAGGADLGDAIGQAAAAASASVAHRGVLGWPQRSASAEA